MKIIVNKTCATVSGAEMLTSGMVGKTIDVEFSADWIGLTKIAVFTNGETTRDVLDPNGSVIIPWEVLVKPNKRVSVGFYGYRIENGEKVLAIPTIWAELGAVRAGADPSGDPSNPPSPEVAEQILAIIGDLENLDTEDKENLVAAINEAYNHDTGSDFDIHSLTPENSIDNADELPFYDVSENIAKKISASAFKAYQKAYFDDLYNKVTKTSELENDSAFMSKFHVNIYYNGIDFFVITPFSDIVEALSSGKEVSVRYSNGISIELPYFKTTNNKVWFYSSLRFGEAIKCIIDSENNVKLYCTSQKSYWDENDEEYKANPLAIFAAAQNYLKDSNGNARGFSTRITITETSTETEIPISETESETVLQVSYSYAANNTFAQIYAAYSNELSVWCCDTNYQCYDLFLYAPADGNNLAAFVFAQEVNHGNVVGYKIKSDNTVEPISIQVYELEDDEDE